MDRPVGITDKFVIAIRLEDEQGSGAWMFLGTEQPPNRNALARSARSLVEEVGGGLVTGRATYFPNTDTGWRGWSKEQQVAKRASDLDARP